MLVKGVTGRSDCKSVISKHMFMSTCGYEIALRWIPLNTFDDKSALVQVKAWCHQATNHYLSQCWPRFMFPYGVSRTQWVNGTTLRPEQNGWHLADNIFKCISFKEIFSFFIWFYTFWIYLKFVPVDLIDNKSTLALVMAWRWTGNKATHWPLGDFKENQNQ